MAVELVSDVISNNDPRQYNHLGLLPTDKQFLSRRWVSRAPNDGIKVKRTAYERIYSQYNKATGEEKDYLEYVLKQLSSGKIDDEIYADPETSPLYNHPAAKGDKHTKSTKYVQQLILDLDAEYTKKFRKIENTLIAATNNPYGYVRKNKSHDNNLATILTTLGHLYNGKNAVPLLPDSDHTVIADFLRQGVQHDNPNSKKLAISSFCYRIEDAVKTVLNMRNSTLDMTFVGDSEPRAILEKTLVDNANDFFLSVGHHRQFANIKEELERIKEKRVKALLARKKNDNKKYNELVSLTPEEIALLERERHRNLDGKPVDYELTELDVNTFAEDSFAKKYRWRYILGAIFVASLILAGIGAVGQLAIAVGAAAGAMAALIGICSGFTNFFLFYVDIKLFLERLFSGTLFKGLSPRLKIILWFYLIVSFGTGIVSGMLVLDLLLGMMGTTILTATGGPLIIGLIVSMTTIIVMGALFFGVGVLAAHALSGQTFFDVRDEQGKLVQKGIWTKIKERLVDFFRLPEFNNDVIRIQNQIRFLQREKNKLNKDDKKRAFLQSEINYLKRKKKVAKGTHIARHWISVVLTFVFAPLALLFAVVTTFALMKISYKGTLDFFSHSLKMAQKASFIISNILTWGFATLVNGALYTKNLVVAAGYFADKIGKFFTGIAYTLGFMFLMIGRGTFFKAIRDFFRAFRDNPGKVIFPGIRSAILVALGTAVALNAMGNAWEYRDNAPFPLGNATYLSRFLTFISAFFGSATLNFMAIVSATAGVPIKKLPANAGKGSYVKAQKQMADTVEVTAKKENDSENAAAPAAKAADAGAVTTGSKQTAALLLPKFRSIGVDKGKLRIDIEMKPLDLPFLNRGPEIPAH